MERLTKSQLESKTVPDLKALCDALSLQVEGMKKGEIVECLLKYYEELDKKSIDDESTQKLEDTNIDDSHDEQSEEFECSDVCEDTLKTVSEDTNESNNFEATDSTNIDNNPDAQLPKTVNIRTPKMLYKDEALTIPICHVGGKLDIISQTSSCYKAVVIISGRGQLEGYLAR